MEPLLLTKSWSVRQFFDIVAMITPATTLLTLAAESRSNAAINYK
jgi:hypothetical protein